MPISINGSELGATQNGAMDKVDAVVIGAGVVGLAVGRALARRGLETVVLEREGAIGTATSSRNSEVIHAGLYYPTGSLKARLCVAGRQALYAYCESHGVAHRRCGKLLVASDESQAARLTHIDSQARANGVLDLVPLSAVQARELEPALQVVAALLSPSTGIIDSHGLMLALLGDLERAGGALAVRSPLLHMQCGMGGHVLQVGGDAPTTLGARVVVNAAGLWAPGLASRFKGLGQADRGDGNPAPTAGAPTAGDLSAEIPTAGIPAAHYAKGSYFALSGRAPFSRLIYPVPQEAGLGVHLTLDLAGQARFGPDVEWITPATPDDIDYSVTASRAAVFEAEIRRYWPGLAEGALQPAYSGVRPKLHGPGEPARDFEVQGPAAHGVPGLVNLYGIESPGLTACLALADEVVARLTL